MEKYKKVMQKQYVLNIISNLTWNEEFELPDGSYSVSDIQDWVYVKNHAENTDNSSIRIFVN